MTFCKHQTRVHFCDPDFVTELSRLHENFVIVPADKASKYRGMFETQKSGNKTSSGEIGLDIRTYASPKVRQDQVCGGVSVLCWHAAPVAKCSMETSQN